MNARALFPKKKQLIFFFIVGLALGLFAFFTAASTPETADVSPDHKIYVAFGFHVNLYHSFRNDTNDENGFGKDIRIIRHIIRTLDAINRQGVPVKGVWDFDNLFSLEEILPRHAPDIIEDIRRRVRDHGDEVILMSYNNGLVSAMTHDELDRAVGWSISNPRHTGVKDLFGTYAPIVRPQEMMTTPGNFSIYKKHGIKAVSLYYSATPFDAFRMFTRQLTREEAHNPVLYHNPQTREDMVLIPTYHVGDLIDHVNLRHWAGELRDLQREGTITKDALIFINFDADSEFWCGIDMPWVLDWVPYTGGLEELIRHIRDLPYVAFTGLSPYLKTHEPKGTVSFNQDTADGSFNGYNSWAEKAGASRHWTVIEHNRRLCSLAADVIRMSSDPGLTSRLNRLIDISLTTRLRALSTTNFGMATPWLTPDREQVADRLAQTLNNLTGQLDRLISQGLKDRLNTIPGTNQAPANAAFLDSLMVLAPSSETIRFVSFEPPGNYDPSMDLVLIDTQGKATPAIPAGTIKTVSGQPRLTLYVGTNGPFHNGLYRLFSLPRTPGNTDASPVDPEVLSNGRLSLQFDNNTVSGIFLDGVRMAEPGSLLPYITWKNKTFAAQASLSRQESSVRVTGRLPGPEGTLSDGNVDYRFSLIQDLPYLVVQADIRYPQTPEQDRVSSSPAMMRPMDKGWEDVAPAEIRFAPKATLNHPVRVLKRNYLGISTEYTLDYFRYHPGNLNLDSVNNHITESYVGVVAGHRGMAMAMDTGLLSNFAFSPLKLEYSESHGRFTVRANPFGTYAGRQYLPHTWGNGNGFQATLAAGEQFAGAGPTYNGKRQQFTFIVAFFNRPSLPETVQKDLISFSHPAPALSASSGFPGFGAHGGRSGLAQADPKPVPDPGHRQDKKNAHHRHKLPLSLELKVLWAHFQALLTS